MSLNKKQEAFCQEYIIDKNGTRSAREAGYSPHTAHVKASQLLKIVKVKDRVDALLALLAHATQISAQSVINGIKQEIDYCVSADKRDSAGVLRGYELLGRHLKLFTDKVEVSGDYNNHSDDEVARELAAAQQENDNVKAEFEVH